MLKSHTIMSLILVLCVPFVLCWSSYGQEDSIRVGVQPDGRIVVPTNQVLEPAGTQITFPGRPVDLALAADGKLLVGKNSKDLVLIDPVTGRLRQTVSIPRQRTKPPGFSVVGG